MLNQAGKPNAAERRKSSRSGSRLDEIGQARRRLYWRALRCSKQLKRPPQTARRPAEEQAERGAARTPALFSSANARTTARLLQGSSFLPSFLCFVFTYCTSLFMQQAEQGKEAAFCCCPLCFLCLLLLRLSEPCVYQRGLFGKKKQRREEEQLQEENEEGKAAAAQAASALTHRPASSSSSSKCSSSSSSKCSSSSKYRAAMQQMQQQQSHSPRPIAQLTKAAQARAREGQQRQDLGTTAAPAQ